MDGEDGTAGTSRGLPAVISDGVVVSVEKGLVAAETRRRDRNNTTIFRIDAFINC
jgi:hypothetical protein